MSNEQLIELITKEVMTRLQAMLSESNIADRKKVLVLEKEDELCPVLISTLKEKNYAVDCLDNMQDLNSYNAIILQNLTNGELGNLSHGIEGSLKEKIAIEALLSGNIIYSLKNGINYKKFAAISNKLFYNMYKDCEDKLKSYGVHFVSIKDLLACIETIETKNDNLNSSSCCVENKEINIPIHAEECLGKNADLTCKKLISEVELRNVLKSGIKNVLVSKKSIVTPLAMDFARINKLQINKM